MNPPMLIAAILAAPLPVLIYMLPTPLSMREEEALLREYFRKKDAAERRGEEYPPR